MHPQGRPRPTTGLDPGPEAELEPYRGSKGPLHHPLDQLNRHGLVQRVAVLRAEENRAMQADRK